MRLRTRLWHWLVIIVVVALAVTGFRLWPRPPLPITIIKTGSFAWPPPGGRPWTAPVPPPAERVPQPR
jgi:hypothetical protein